MENENQLWPDPSPNPNPSEVILPPSPQLQLYELIQAQITEAIIPLQQFKETISNNVVDYKFLIEATNPEGLYQTRLLYLFIAIVFMLSLHIFQIVYLFIPPNYLCPYKQNQNLLIEKNSTSYTNHQLHYYGPANPNIGTSICSESQLHDCRGKVLYADKAILENATCYFSLYCRRSYLRVIIQSLVFVSTLIGALIADLLRKKKRIKKMVLHCFLFLFSITVLIYSLTFLQIDMPNQQEGTVIRKSIVKQAGENNSKSLFEIVEEKQLYIFIILFSLSYLFLGGIVIMLFSYLKDCFPEFLLNEVRNHLYSSFAMSQLLGALLRLIINDWRKFNIFIIALPTLLLSIASLFILKKSLLDLLYVYIQLLKSKIKECDIEEKKLKLQEEIYLLLKEICDINQRPFFSKVQFSLVFNRYLSCFEKEQPIVFIRMIGLTYILSSLIIIYFAPLFLLHNYGTGISFNMFTLALSEILGLMATMRFVNRHNLRNGIKMNLMVCGIIGLTVSFSNFYDTCDDETQICPSKMIQFMIACQLRFFCVAILFQLLKFFDKENDVFQIGFTVSLSAGIIPLLLIILNLQIDQFFLIISLFPISASWAVSLLK